MKFALRTKISLSFVAILVLMALMAAIFVSQSAIVNQTVQKNYTHGLIGVKRTGDAIVAALNAREELLLLVSAPNADEQQQHYTAMNDYITQMETLISKYESLIETQGARSALADYTRAWDDFEIAAEEVARLALVGEIEAASLALRGNAEHRVRSAIDHLLLVQDIEDNLSAARYVESQALFQRTRNVAIGITVVAVLAGLGLVYWLGRTISDPLAAMAETAQKVAAGEFSHTVPVPAGGEDEITVLARAFNHMTFQVRNLIGSLEQRVANRTRDLERRSAYLEAAAEVGRAASSILEADQLIRQVVELIRQRFDLYYVGLFQVDEQREWAVLQAGTGEAGRAMLARGHRIRIGEGMIGWSISNAESRIASRAESDAQRLATTELPDTRSEAALPLRSHGQVIGALTVQSDQPAAFDKETITVLQTMADQVAVALDNARLFAQAQEALEAERRAYGEISRAAWEQIVHARPDLGYLCDTQDRIRSAPQQWQPEMLQASQQGRTVQDGESTLIIPLRFRDQVLGVVRLRKPDTAGKWTAEEVRLMENLTDQLSVALESARLHQDAQRRAAREQLIGEVTARMRETLDVETVLKTAVDELYDALRVEELSIHLSSATIEGAEHRPPSLAPRRQDGNNGAPPDRADGKESPA